MEYRRNLLTREWVAYGPEIVSPEELLSLSEPRQSISDLFNGEELPCPFCPEKMPDDQINIFSVHLDNLSSGGFPRDSIFRDDPWDVKVIPAYQPVFRIESPLRREPRRLHDVMKAPGAHEKIILSSDHGVGIWDMPARRLELVFQVLRHRMVNLSRDPRLGHQYAYMVFGSQAGGAHAHSVLNLTASPFVVHKVRRELDGAYQWYKIKERCLFSDLFEEEIQKRDRGKPHGIIFESMNFISIIPFFASYPFEVWIMPVEHTSDFTHTPVNLIPELSRVFLRVMTTLRQALGPFPFTLSVMNQPSEAWGVKRGYWKTVARDWLWRLRIVPDIPLIESPSRAFKSGTGVRLNPVLPESSAAFIRNLI